MADSLAIALNEILQTLAGVSQGGAYRLVGPDGNIVAEAGHDAEICQATRRHCGTAFCHQHCWRRVRTEQGGISACASGAVQIVIPLTFGSRFLGHLYCGDFRLVDSPTDNAATWSEVSQRVQLDQTWLEGAYHKLPEKTREELEQLQQNLRKLLEDQILDKLLELRIKEVKTYIVKLDEVPRGELWRRIQDEVLLLARVGTFELFTVSPARDAITRECPPAENWDGRERFRDFAPAEATGSFTDSEGRLVLAVKHEDRLLAFMRVHSTQSGGFVKGDKDSERLRKLADALAEALSLRRHQRAEKILGELYLQMVGKTDHRLRLSLILKKCLALLDCQNGEVLLKKPVAMSDEPNALSDVRLDVVVREGIADEMLPLPSFTSGSQGLLRRVLATEQVVTVPDTSLDSEFYVQTEAAELRGKYPENIRMNLGRYQRSIRSCVKIPLTVGQEVRGVMCLHREREGHFYLGMVHVVELLARSAAAELACVLVSEEYSARADGFRTRMSKREELVQRVAGLEAGTARKRLFEMLATEAQELTGAYRAAVALINEDWTKVSVMAETDGWPRSQFELPIPLGNAEHNKSGVLKAILKGQSHLVSDVNAIDASYFSPTGDQGKVISSANIRLECGPNLLGVLVLDWTTPQTFDPVTRDMLETLARNYADAIHAYDVHQLTLKLDQMLREREPSKLKRVSVRELDYQPLLEHAARMIGVAEGALFLRDPDTGLFDLKANLMRPELVDEPGQSYALGEGLTGWIAKMNHAIHIRDLSNPEEVARVAPGAEWRDKIRDNDEIAIRGRRTSFLGAPLSMGSEVLGVLRFNIDSNWRPFDIFDESLAESISQRMGDWLYNYYEDARRIGQLQLLERIPGSRDSDEFIPHIYDAIETGIGRVGCHIRMGARIQEGRSQKPERVFLLKGKPKIPYWIPMHEVGASWKGPSRFHRINEDATGMVWNSHESFVEQDVAGPNSQCRAVKTPEWFLNHVGSVIVVPLMIDDEIVGTLHVYKPNPNSFTPAERDYLESIAHIAAMGLISLADRDRSETEKALRKVADVAVHQLLFHPESPQLDQHLMMDLLAVLKASLRARQGWFLWPSEGRDGFTVMESSGVPVSIVPRVSTSRLEAILKPNGFQLAFGLGKDDEIRRWVNDWTASPKEQESYLQRAKELQYLLIAMKDDHQTSTVFCLEADPEHVISYEDAKSLKEILDQIHQNFHLALEFLKTRQHEQQRFEEAARPLCLIGATASSMEHSLRGPVDNLVKSLEYLTKQPRDPEQIQHKLEYMRAQVGSLNSSVQKLISVSGGKQRSVPVSLQAIVDQAIVHTHELLPCVEQTSRDTSLLVLAAEKLLSDAFELLLMNAAEAAKEHRGSAARVSVEVDSANGNHRVRISDNGPGMDVSSSMRPFVSTKGTQRGLGLPTALFLIRIHGGRLDIDSAKGRGTTVTVTLPPCLPG